VEQGEATPDFLADGEHELCRLIYFSRASAKITRQDLKEILAKSQQKNALTRVRGALYFDQSQFLQVLEGNRYDINRLFQKICADKRHIDVSIISFYEISERIFPNWSMLLLGSDAKARSLYQRYCGSNVFQPSNMTGAGATAFVTALAAPHHKTESVASP
jgi:hypothetical protein